MNLFHLKIIYLFVALAISKNISTLSEKLSPKIITELNTDNNQRIAVPNLIGMKYTDVQKILKKKSIRLGSTIYTLEGGSRNLEDQVVYKQNPQAKNDKGVQNYLKKRQAIDIWIVGITPGTDSSKKIRIRTIDKVDSN